MELTVRKICRQNGRRSQETNIDYFAQEEEGAQVISNLWREKGLGHSQSCQIVIRTGKKCAGLALFTGKLSSCCGLMNLEEIRKSLSLDDPESLEEDSYANQLYTHAFFQWIHVKIASEGKVCKCMHFAIRQGLRKFRIYGEKKVPNWNVLSKAKIERISFNMHDTFI